VIANSNEGAFRKAGAVHPVLQELGGWESVEMVRRYAHLAANHLAPYADHLGARWEVASQMCHGYGTFMAQPGKEKGAASLQPLD
jgi:hypothetical protein